MSCHQQRRYCTMCAHLDSAQISHAVPTHRACFFGIDPDTSLLNLLHAIRSLPCVSQSLLRKLFMIHHTCNTIYTYTHTHITCTLPHGTTQAYLHQCHNKGGSTPSLHICMHKKDPCWGPQTLSLVLFIPGCCISE